MVHGFTSSGLLAQQYRYFCDAAGIGRLSPFYIREMYNKHNYLNTIRQVAKDSMQQSIFKALDAQPEDDNRVSMFFH
jgi:hypothetical protein